MTEAVDKSVKRMLVLSLVLTGLFVLGVPGIVLGAVFRLWVLFGFSALFAVAGFYGTPLAWVQYANCRRYRSVCLSVLADGICDVCVLARNHGQKEKQMRALLKTLLAKRYIVGYAFDAEEKMLVAVEQKGKEEKIIAKCPACGGPLASFLQESCAYCGCLVQKTNAAGRKK